LLPGAGLVNADAVDAAGSHLPEPGGGAELPVAATAEVRGQVGDAELVEDDDGSGGDDDGGHHLAAVHAP
jgi:hypothetical protein